MPPTHAATALARASRISAILTAVGAVAVLAGLVFSANELVAAQARLAQVEQRRMSAEAQLRATATKLARSRCALASSRSAIEAFHQRDYGAAIALYDEALRCDPDNAYLLNLDAYSHFKSGDVAGAVALEQRSVQADPSYGWGYFDLARFSCARDGRRTAEAQAAIDTAIRLDARMPAIMAADGEFRRLCRDGAG